eukprot:12938763-Prorocentrum_lima.AAC.1
MPGQWEPAGPTVPEVWRRGAFGNRSVWASRACVRGRDMARFWRVGMTPWERWCERWPGARSPGGRR